jgi:hypothetical protein
MSDIPRNIAPTNEADLGPNEALEDGEILEDAEVDADEAGGDEGVDDEQEEGPEAEDDVDPAPAPRRGGGSQTIREQRRRAQEAERRAAEAERRVQHLEQQVQTIATRFQQDPQAQARAEQEWLQQLEMMPPAQAYQAVIQRGRQEFGGALQQLRMEQHELADQARYEASCARSPTRDAYRDRVEQYRAEQRRAGFVIGREEAFHLLYGRDLEARANKARPAQQRAGQRNIARQQTRPTGARSTVSPQSRRPAPGSLEADEALINAAIARGESVF